MEFAADAIAGIGIYATVLIVFLLFRRFTRLRIRSVEREPLAPNAKVKFSLKYLMVLTTLYGIAFGLTIQLRLSTSPSSFFFSDEDIFYMGLYMVTAVGEVIAGLVLPTLAVPFVILFGKPTRRAIALMILFWVAATAPFAAYLLLTPSGVFPNPEERLPLSVVCTWLFVPQATAALAGILTALPLRLAGYRLVRLAKATSPNQSNAELAA